MGLCIYKLTSFPKESNGGNEAGVVLDADSLTDNEMLQIARDIGFKEIKFIDCFNR